MIYVDFMTQRRIVKDSAFWYQDVIKTNGGNLSMNQTTKEILFLDPVMESSTNEIEWNHQMVMN